MSYKSEEFYLKKSKIIKPILLTTLFILAVLSFYIPYVTDQNSINTIVANSINSANQMKLTRAYYLNNVVKDIQEKAPQITFSYAHEGINGILPLPTTTIHDLSKIFSERTGIHYSLYSEYPFKNREQRKLSAFEKEAIQYTKLNPDGVYVKRDKIDGKEVLRVATTDFMSEKACVQCHNNHPDRTWEEGKWKLGDKRGVVEVITPLENEIAANNNLKYSILIFITTIIIGLVGYYTFVFVRRENELFETIGNKRTALEKEVELSLSHQAILEEYKNAIDVSAIVSKTDINGIITYVNDAFCEFSGYSREELLGKHHNIVYHPDENPIVYEKIWEMLRNKKIFKATLKNISKEGTTYYFDTNIIPIINKNSEIHEVLALRYNVTEHMHALEDAKNEKKLSREDFLTKLYNKRGLEEFFYVRENDFVKSDHNYALILFDIDFFKEVNDTYGHDAGDKILVEVAKILSRIARGSDIVGRFGGEEFIAIIDYLDAKGALEFAEKVNTIIKNHDFTYNTQIIKITMSGGLAQRNENGSLEETLKMADTNLYLAKQRGRDQIVS